MLHECASCVNCKILCRIQWIGWVGGASLKDKTVIFFVRFLNIYIEDMYIF